MGTTSRAELRIPCDLRMLRLARVTAASMAADLPFTVQDIEDLRVAVDELAAAIIDSCDHGSHLLLTFESDDETVTVRGRVEGAGEAPELHPVAADLLSMLADHHELTTEGDDRVFMFTKQPSTLAP